MLKSMIFFMLNFIRSVQNASEVYIVVILNFSVTLKLLQF